MANGKYLNVKKPQYSKNRNYNPRYAHSSPAQPQRNIKRRKTSKRYKSNKSLKKQVYKSLYNLAVYMESKPKFKMKRKDKQKIYALLAAGVLTVGMFRPGKPDDPEIPTPTETTPSISTEEVFVPETTEPEIIYAIGIPNKNAKIMVGDKYYQIDPNSFIMVNGNEALAYDTVGNFIKGFINTNDYEKIMDISSKELDNYNISQVISETDVNVRSSGAILDNNIISSVPSYDYVLSYKPNTFAEDKEWISTISINDGQLHEGYIREDMLQEIDSFENLDMRTELNMKNAQDLLMVDTAIDGYISLKLRQQPKGNILTKIPHGSFVQQLGENAMTGDTAWSLVRYETTDGQEFEGWVASDYLKEYVVEGPIAPTVVDGINVNLTGNVTIIDFSTIEPEKLEELFKNGIPHQVNAKGKLYDTSSFCQSINGAYIKIGSSNPYTEDLYIEEYSSYEKQVELCEKLGIPYGFYYYSTAITEEEAKIEFDCIQSRLEALQKKLDLQNNKFPFAVDIEIANKNDRQLGTDNVLTKTEAKAKLINDIQDAEFSDEVLFYGPMRVMKSDLDQIVNLDYLGRLLDNKDSVSLWLTSTMKQNGDITEDLKNDIAYGEELGFSTVTTQLVLDAKLNDKDKYSVYDIDNMNFDYYKKQISKEIKKDTKSFWFDFNNQDDER